MASEITKRSNGPREAEITIVLAHGAGAPMDSPFMEYFAKQLGANGFRVVRFEFPYMAARRRTESRRPPDREPVLRESWLSVIGSVKSPYVFIGGKSMGGRIASLVADENDVSGLVCLGYPFHPIGKPEKLRTQHLEAIQTPSLIVQGERDTMGNRETVNRLRLSNKIDFAWLPDGDHSFKPRKSSGHTEQENWAQGVQAVTHFVSENIAESPQ